MFSCTDASPFLLPKFLIFICCFYLLWIVETLLKAIHILPRIPSGSAEIRSILWRCRLGLADVNFSRHFLSWPVGLTAADRLLNGRVSLYGVTSGGLDFADFSEPVHECLAAERATFCHDSAHRTAARLLRLEHAEFSGLVDKLSSRVNTRVVVMANSCRSGSTLVCNVMGRFCPRVIAYSEPAYPLSMMLHSQSMATDERREFIRRVFRFECRPVEGKEGYYIKLTHVFLGHVPDMADGVPEVKFMYLDRKDRSKQLRSINALANSLLMFHFCRILLKYRADALLGLLFGPQDAVVEEVMRHASILDLSEMSDLSLVFLYYMALTHKMVQQRMGGAFPTFYYEDILDGGVESLRQIAQLCGFEGPFDEAGVADVFGADSQADTVLSRDRLKNTLENLHVTDAMLARWNAYANALGFPDDQIH